MPERSTRDPADSPRASAPPDFAIVAARELLATAIELFPGHPPIARAVVARFVLEACGESVATALADAGAVQERGAQEVIPHLLDVIGKFQNPWLALRCLPIAFSLPSQDENETSLAAEFGVTKGAVSNICVTLCEKFGLSHGRGMKRPAARASYAKRQQGQRARPLPTPWPHKGLFSGLQAALKKEAA